LKNNYYICDEDYDVVIFLSIKFKIVNMKREKVAHFNASLTPSEIETLADISFKVLGKVNKSGIIRYWINKHKKKYKDVNINHTK